VRTNELRKLSRVCLTAIIPFMVKQPHSNGVLIESREPTSVIFDVVALSLGLVLSPMSKVRVYRYCAHQCNKQQPQKHKTRKRKLQKSETDSEVTAKRGENDECANVEEGRARRTKVVPNFLYKASFFKKVLRSLFSLPFSKQSVKSRSKPNQGTTHKAFS
jgi:hypothetical protein